MSEALSPPSALRPNWPESFRHRVVYWVAEKRDEVWVLRYALVMFGPMPFSPSARQIKTNSIWIGCDKGPVNESFQDFADALRARPTVIRVAEELFDLAPELEKPPSRFTLLPFGIPEYQEGSRRPAATISLDLNSPFPINLATLSLELQAADTPSLDFDDALAWIGILRPAQQLMNQSPRIDYVAFPPTELRLHECTLRDGTLTIKIGAHPEIEPEKLKVGLRIHTPNSQSRFSRPLTELPVSWSEEDEVRVATIVENYPDASMINVALSYGGEFIQRWWIDDTSRPLNRLLGLFTALAPDKKLEDEFFERFKDFEDSVALLLTLLGCHVLHTGNISWLNDGPDYVIPLASGHILVVEATAMDISRKGKLHNLVTRAADIERRLGQANHPVVAVLPVVFTGDARDKTAGYWETCASYGIALVCREDIVQMLQLVRFGTPKDFFDRLTALVPKAKPNAQPG